MADRHTLHINQLENFKAWLIKAGWEIEEPKGIYEVLRARKENRQFPLIVYRKHRAKQHLSLQERDLGVVKAFLREKKQSIANWKDTKCGKCKIQRSSPICDSCEKFNRFVPMTNMEDKLFVCKDCGKPTNNKYILKMSFGNDLVIHRCDDCQDKLDVKYEWKNEKWREDNIICPWCEEEISDYEDMRQVVDEPYNDFEGTVKCPFCEKEFELEIETKCQYTSRKPSEQFNYEEWLESEREE